MTFPAALTLALLAPPARGADAIRIGAAGAVSGGVAATPLGNPTARPLASGSQVFHKDAITTDAKGRLQVMLVDQTVFTMGPQSRIILDEFVYDPFTTKGKLTAEVTKGVFRFVTGKSAHGNPNHTKIKTPSGTIGIRGTFGAGSVGPDGTLVGLLGPGPDNNSDENTGGLTVTNDKGSVDLNEPGTGTIMKDGEPPSPPFKLSEKDLGDLNAGGTDPGDDGATPAAKTAAAPAEDEEEGSDSASATAGQETAAAIETSGETSDEAAVAEDLGDTTAVAAQAAAGGIQDGIAKWDDVRAIQSGQAHYNGTGAWNLTSCNGGTCANSSNGSFTFAMNIDFGARTVGGKGSSVSGTDTDTAGGGRSVSPSVVISERDFSALSGAASFSETSGACSVSVDLLNAGGAAAAKAAATLTLSGSDAGTGTLTAERFEGLIPQ